MPSRIPKHSNTQLWRPRATRSGIPAPTVVHFGSSFLWTLPACHYILIFPMSRLPTKSDGYLPDSLHTTSDEADDGDLVMGADSHTHDFSPPPHIAARFYRPSNNRRRSSAASSRRNSISSAHSHHSHHSHQSYHGPQSNHVAQHLRRASILENRKARLADRAAHAEKVRLRAAMAKAAPRPSNSEERALAAQQAREKYLAQVTAACAEEVKRAKKVAEDIKEKREAEGRKMRGEREEKLAEAERRRVEYKRNVKRSRGLSLPPTEDKTAPAQVAAESVIDEVQAALRIQAAWRSYRRKETVNAFLTLGVTVENVRGTGFEEVGMLLNQDKVLSGTAKVLELCGLEDGDNGTTEEKAAVRTFLSAFLILGHPAQVLSNDGEQEQVRFAPSHRMLLY